MRFAIAPRNTLGTPAPSALVLVVLLAFSPAIAANQPATTAQLDSPDVCAQQAPASAPEIQKVESTEDTLSIRADTQEKEKSTYRLRGHVQVAFHDAKLSADEATYDDQSGEVVAKGHVVFTDSSAHLEADEAHYNVMTGKGWFANGQGYIQAKLRPRSRVLVSENPIYVKAARVERVDAETYTANHVRVTSCPTEAKGWSVGAHHAKLDVGDKVTARGANIRILKIPVFYAPIFVHSVAQNPRRSGFLLPNVGHSSQKGFTIGDGFFWAINPSVDLLLGVENYSVRGVGGTGRFRARPSANSDLTVDYFGVNDKGGGSLRQFRAPGQTVRATGQARDLFRGFRGVLDVDWLSSLAFRQTFTNNFAQAVASEIRQTGFLTKNFDAYSVNVYVSRYQNFLCSQGGQSVSTISAQNCPLNPLAPGDSITIRQSPSFSISGMDKPLGGTPFYFAFEGSADGVSRSEPGFQTPRLSERLDFSPHVLLRSKPFWGFHLTPSLGLRATRYGTSLARTRDPLNRVLGEFAIDLRPPPLQKVFVGSHWGRRFKHVVEPQVRYRLVRSLNNANLRDVVRYDSVDVLAETSEVEYSLTNLIFTRPDVPGDSREKPQARELISWRMSQRYYFDPTFGGVLDPGRKFVFEPTLSLTGFAFAQGQRLSPINSVLKFSPFSNYDTELSTDINPSGGGVRNVGITSRIHSGPVGVALTEFFINRTAVFTTSPSTSAPVLSRASFNLLRAVTTYGDINRKGLSAALALDYNLDLRIAHQVVSQVSYNFGCLALDFEFRRFELGNLRRENQFRLALSLANIGTFGNLKPRERLY